MQGNCRPALCSAGKLLDETEGCQSAVEQIRGLGYKLFLVLQPQDTTLVTTDDMVALGQSVSQQIVNVTVESEIHINISAMFNKSRRLGRLGYTIILAYFVGNRSVKRDAYEAEIIKKLVNDWPKIKVSKSNLKINLYPVIVGEGFQFPENKDLQDVDNFSMKYSPHCEDSKSPTEMRKLPNFVRSLSESKSGPVLLKSKKNPTREERVTFSYVRETCFKHVHLWALKHKFVDVTHSLVCPFVYLNISNMTTEENFTEISFNFRNKNFKVKSTERVAVVNGYLHICVDVFKNLTGSVWTEAKTINTTLGRVRYLVEIICSSLSVVSLVFSAITYCLFPTLRSLPGWNNLSLCVTLAGAHIFLLVTVIWGVNGCFPSRYCLAHALLLHYLWLSAFAWMSICCIHMYRVFTTYDNTFCDARSDRKRYKHYCIYGFGLPLLIVITTLTINTSLTSGHSTGYNSDICFLDTRRTIWSVVFSLYAPLCLVILTNGYLFAKTSIQMVKVSKVQEHAQSGGHQGMLTYVKLSTLTGVLGAVFVVAIQLDSEIAILLTSPFIALQGVFIFFSFTCNARVRGLYLNLLHHCRRSLDEKNPRTKTKSASKTRSSSADSNIKVVE
ncbi:G-protein coupled receptor 64-like [Plakobranchus ocellatus]|uniref:G-protein coupled receptor 64-like n=1 Tax=Plakobranchus ocellatus TaxID=259542 RepID=A0AAV4DFC3_9GAST|nr:G-protein coupled receptor 64-like [Plakobranchus ocellatus]